MLHTSCPDELLAYEYVHGVTGSRTGIFSLEDPHHTVAGCPSNTALLHTECLVGQGMWL